MKITKKELKKLIREEVKTVLKEYQGENFVNNLHKIMNNVDYDIRAELRDINKNIKSKGFQKTSIDRMYKYVSEFWPKALKYVNKAKKYLDQVTER